MVVVPVVAAVATGLAVQANRRAELSLENCALTEVARVSTGHQRAERLAFADRGRLLAVTCPRYNRVVLYRVTSGESLDLHRDIPLEGHPVAICPVEDRLYILQRPVGDARHIEPGYWETYDFRGRRLGSRFRVGFYPDDLTITPDGRHALVLTSGNAEGDEGRPRPALAVVALGDDAAAHREVGRVEFDRHGDDPERLALSATGRWAIVGLRGSNQSATIDLSDPARPRVVGRADRGTTEGPSPLVVEGDNFASPVSRGGDAIQLELPEVGSCVAYTRTQVSGLELYEAASRRPLGRLRLRGALNMSPTRPTGVAYAAGRSLIAVATRSGSVHLIAVRPGPDQPGVAATEAGVRRR
jgi:glycerol-3-phosphate acyltransferase PlsY